MAKPYRHHYKHGPWRGRPGRGVGAVRNKLFKSIRHRLRIMREGGELSVTEAVRKSMEEDG
jgi:hypothetical protein